MAHKKPMIVLTRYSPYYVVDLDAVQKADGEKLPLDPVSVLCRCGNSKNKPFCDGSHQEKGLNEGKKKDRVPDVLKAYEGESITILDNRGVCSHDGSCLRELPRVFRKNHIPWIDPDGAPAAAIIAAIEHCPSGALSYQLGSRRYQELEAEPAITLAPNGPLHVQGGILLKDDKGSRPECREHYTLCRCGGSKNKPFCDGAHLDNGFSDRQGG